VASAIVGLAGGGALYEAGEHGGELVYSYAGGIGIRSGDSSDVPRLLLAGLYQSALQARARHDSATAGALFGELARRWPADTNVRLLAIQSLLQDKHDGRGALEALARFTVPADNARLAVGVGYLRADAFVAVGKPDSARVVLEALVRQFPDDSRIKDRLAKLK
jgi:predicted Zn-dependent protease